MNSTGTTKITLLWIGQGPAPERVLVRLGSSATAETGALTSAMTVDSGLGHPIFWDGESPEMFSGGNRLRYVSIAGGVGEVTVSSSASAAISGMRPLYAKADAYGASGVIHPKAATLGSNPAPTYVEGPSGMPIIRKQNDAKLTEIGIGCSYASLFNNGYMSAEFLAELWGLWGVETTLSRSGAGEWTGGSAGNPNFRTTRTISDSYSTSDLVAMTRAPREYETQLTALDSDMADDARGKLKVYAPWFLPSVTSNNIVYTGWIATSGWVYRTPNATNTVTYYSQVQKSVTKQIEVSPEFSISSPGHPLGFSLGVNVGLGETASLSKGTSVSATIAPGPATMKYAYFQRVMWRERNGFYLAYGQSGFEGIRNFRIFEWLSGSKTEAEQSDKEYWLRGVEAQP